MKSGLSAEKTFPRGWKVWEALQAEEPAQEVRAWQIEFCPSSAGSKRLGGTRVGPGWEGL